MTDIQSHSVSKAFYHSTPPSNIGESPVYRASDNTLHWVDINSTSSTLSILSLTPDGKPMGTARVVPTSVLVTLIRFVTDQPTEKSKKKDKKGDKEEKSPDDDEEKKPQPHYICGYEHGIGILNEKTGVVQVLRTLVVGGELRMNDGGIDPQGRLWIGETDLSATVRVMKGGDLEKEHRKGRLWCFNGKTGKCDIMEHGFICVNGIGWSPDGKTMYVGDSGTQALYRYSFNGETGKISDRETVFEGLEKGSLNDGLVVDEEGNIWVAIFAAGCVNVYSPDGKQIKKITFPAKGITCTGWGGKDNNVLFASSGNYLEKGEKVEGSEEGHVFSFEAGVKGMPNVKFIASGVPELGGELEEELGA